MRICTSPLYRYENCVLEKYQWVEKHLGRDFTKRMILSKDKAIIQGKFLIDDKSSVDGEERATWEHVIYHYPYNIENKNKRRLTWINYKEILGGG